MPPNEQTPLIQTVIVTPSRERYSHSAIRRFCTAALSFTLVVVIVLFLVPARWLPGNHSESEWSPNHSAWSSYSPHASWPETTGLSFERLEAILLNTPKENKAQEWSQYYTAGPHLAGKNLSQALWTRDKWQEFGIKSEVVSYDTYINYPLNHRLALLEETRNDMDESHESNIKLKQKHEYKLLYECSMKEDVLEEDPTSGLHDRIPTFHGYSASGNVTARFVYVNFGTYYDFEDLVARNISLKGNIAVAKYGAIFRGLKVKRAQELGMVGVVIYTDPQEDGDVTEQNGYEAYPNGPARNPSSVQRGSTQFLSFAPGDPTTPGYPSKPGVPRKDTSHAIPKIPSVPISYEDALPILKALNGHGPQASEFNDYWQGGGLGYKGVEYNIGPSPSGVLLNLVNEQEYTTTPLWNVIGIINGTLEDEVVILGNHRDAWIAGGAGDPNSGSATMNEVIRSFGVALKAGYKPLRTIVFASWDGEEYGLIGSTEWVEEYIPWLSKAAIAYLNVDVAVRGPHFTAAASPILNKALYEVTSVVQSPNQSVPGQTVGDLWDLHIRTMGSGSDFTAFQDFAGIPSLDMGFAGGSDSPVYHYHSNYDSISWMEKYGDPGWHYHIALTKVLGLLAAKLVETPVIAFNATDYAIALRNYLHTVKGNASSSPNLSVQAFSAFPTLFDAIERLYQAATDFDVRAAKLAAAITSQLPWWQWWQRAQWYHQVRTVNAKYKYFERKFLHPEGLDERTWFKHVVFAPGKWTGYSGATLPGLVESVDAGDEEGVRRWTEIIKGKIDDAAASLK